MAEREQFIFQPYVNGKRGNIAAGPAIQCRTKEEAGRRAEKAMAGGQVIGCHVVRMLVDEDVGDFGEPEYLAAFGIVPEAV